MKYIFMNSLNTYLWLIITANLWINNSALIINNYLMNILKYCVCIIKEWTYTALILSERIYCYINFLIIHMICLFYISDQTSYLFFLFVLYRYDFYKDKSKVIFWTCFFRYIRIIIISKIFSRTYIFNKGGKKSLKKTLFFNVMFKIFLLYYST